jgi:RNA polymerase sigma-70 factor, ECF subfamily
MGKSGTIPIGRATPSRTQEPLPEARPEHAIVVAFHELRDELISTLVYVLGNRDDALDAVQDAFLKCWRARDKVAEVQNLRAWIFRVGLNTAKDQQRSAWSRKVKPLGAEETMLVSREAKSGADLEDEESLRLLRTAIAQLRTDEKEVFLLRQNGNLTYEQIAEIRQAPVGTVKTQMRSALSKLRLALNRESSPDS